ncbi:MAG: hypothetical protein PHE25_04080, partial [Candidatus Gracilibacteria bacterium]|nr:hypothetical protein [Candidatus Gracilibacteria bacterium]
MLGNIFDIIILFFITLIPVVLWGYLFSFFDDNNENRKRFIVGIIAGIISVGPVLYLEDFINDTNFLYLNVFSSVAGLSNFLDVFKIFISFFSILFFVSIIPFLIFSSFSFGSEKIKTYCKNYLIFTIYLIFIGLAFYFFGLIFDKLAIFDKTYDFGLSFGNIVFNSFKLVIFYYIIIAILEELSKFFCFNYSQLFSLI